MIRQPTGEKPVNKVEQGQPKGVEGHKPVADKVFQIAFDHINSA